MKKLFVILAAMGMTFAMTSCKKTCICEPYQERNAPTSGVILEEKVEDYKDYGVKRCSDLNKKVPELKDFKCK